RGLRFHRVACDFLLGLEGTTPAGMLEQMETVLRRFRPNWLDIFMLTPTAAYVDSHFGGSWDAFWSHLKPFEETIPPALTDLAKRNQYRVRTGRGHHMMLERESRLPKFLQVVIQVAAALIGVLLPRRRHPFFYTPLTSEARRPV